MNILDLLTPHMHKITGLDMEEHRNNGASVNRVLLFVMAVAIHKLPEGIATGVGFNAEELSGAWAVTFGIALQNIPEGMVVVTPLLLVGVKKMRAFLISLAIGSCRRMARLWHRSHLPIPATRDASFCRRRHAIRCQRRNDPRNPRPRISKDGHLCPLGWLYGDGIPNQVTSPTRILPYPSPILVQSIGLLPLSFKYAPRFAPPNGR